MCQPRYASKPVLDDKRRAQKTRIYPLIEGLCTVLDPQGR
jgi:hypothetical protein